MFQKLRAKYRKKDRVEKWRREEILKRRMISWKTEKRGAKKYESWIREDK